MQAEDERVTTRLRRWLRVEYMRPLRVPYEGISPLQWRALALAGRIHRERGTNARVPPNHQP